MKGPQKAVILDEVLDLLIRHFGREKVQSRFDGLAPGRRNIRSGTLAAESKQRKPANPISVILTSIRENDPEKHRLLTNFYDRLKTRTILPEAEDIRHFAQLIGLKNISGKSRKELVSQLLKFLIATSTERLGPNIESAETISDQQRQKGFSVLTDKLLGEK
jgi:hypothetical protein